MIAGISLIVFAIIMMFAANILHFEAEAELLEKRPELLDELYLWGIFRRHRLVERFYNAEFPRGRRVRQYWLSAIVGALSFFSGFFIIVFLQ
jgi:hypothetical protein